VALLTPALVLRFGARRVARPTPNVRRGLFNAALRVEAPLNLALGLVPSDPADRERRQSGGDGG
jgi:hypothetical protein